MGNSLDFLVEKGLVAGTVTALGECLRRVYFCPVCLCTDVFHRVCRQRVVPALGEVVGLFLHTLHNLPTVKYWQGLITADLGMCAYVCDDLVILAQL